MARIRARFQLNKGRLGIAPDKLVRQFEKLIEIVNAMAVDLGLDSGTRQWVVSDFQNGSVDSLWEHQTLTNSHTAVQWNSGLEYIARIQENSLKSDRPSFLADRTVSAIASFSEVLDPGEPFVVGVFDSDETPHDQPRWLETQALDVKALAEQIYDLIEYDGCISGSPYEITMGADRPFFKIRESTTDERVKCFYEPSQHASIHAALKDRNALVYVYGLVRQSQLTGKFGDVDARYVETAPQFSPADFEKFLGAAPKLTGRLNSETFVAKIRGNG